MGGNYLGNAGTFLIQTLFGLYIMIIMLRTLLQVVRADFYNPVSQFLVKATNPPLKPLRRLIPGLFGIDLAAIVLMLALQFIELWITVLLLGHSPALAGLLVWSVAELLHLLVNVFLFSILIQVIISWINPGAYNPITALLYPLTEPILRPARRLLPPLGGMDLSPIVAMLGLQLASMLIVAPVADLGKSML